MKEPGRWAIVALYAAGMAWVESAVVFYLRTMTNRIDPYQANPLPIIGGLAEAELMRELSTLVMLFTVGWLAGRNWPTRIAYSAIAFGLWDILYYVFLKVICGWPKSVMDWDVLFLLPLPWWGPVLAPVLIAFLMVAWGTLITQFDLPQPAAVRIWAAWLLNAIGIVVALYVFMTDAIAVAGQGGDALRNVLPKQFNWPLFIFSLILMSAPVLEILWRRASPVRVPAGMVEEDSPVLSRKT